MTEQEQIQQIKTWLKQYGFTIVLGILLALVLTTAWRYWQTYQENKLIHASFVYDEMLNLRAQNKMDAALKQANKLITDYPGTPYAPMATLLRAKDAVSKKNYSEASTQLQWVLDHSKDSGLREIALTRLARILIAEKKPQEAIRSLATIDDKSFMGLIDEIRGDAYFSMNDMTSARSAYKRALQELPNAEMMRPILKMKYDNLAT